MFQLCYPLEENAHDEREVGAFYDDLVDIFGETSQYNNIDPDSKNLDQLCAIMTDPHVANEIDRLASITKPQDGSCTPNKYSSRMEQLKMSNWSESSERQWMYQTCTQLGEFHTSDGPPQIFGNKFPLRCYIGQCTEVFGPGFDEDYIKNSTDYNNSVYGGLNINMTNVVFVHGSVDPYYKLGITKTVNPQAPAIFIQGTAHCADMSGAAENDLPQLTEARPQISQLIQGWLGL